MEYDYDLNGNIKELPDYLIQDANKILKINSSSTGIEWSNLINESGFIANSGNGNTNTTNNYVGFCYSSNPKTGLFNYGPTNETLGLRIDGNPILELQNDGIYPIKNIICSNDPLLSTGKISFADSTTYITGTNTTNKQISFNCDSQEILRLSNDTTQHILFKKPLRIENQLYSASNPHIFCKSSTSNICGISFDPVYNKIEISCGIIPAYIQRIENNLVTFTRAVYNQRVTCNDIRHVSGTIYNITTNQSDMPIIYAKRHASNNTTIILPYQPSCPEQYRIIVDQNGISTANFIYLNTTNMDVLFIDNGIRTLFTYPFSNIDLGINRVYDCHYSAADTRWIVIKIT